MRVFPELVRIEGDDTREYTVDDQFSIYRLCADLDRLEAEKREAEEETEKLRLLIHAMERWSHTDEAKLWDEGRIQTANDRAEEAETEAARYKTALELRLYYHIGDHTDLYENRCIPCEITKDAAEAALGYDELPADWKPAALTPLTESDSDAKVAEILQPLVEGIEAHVDGFDFDKVECFNLTESEEEAESE